MAYKISDACISCGACAGGCPVEAIAEGDGQFVIDADKCIDCGACAAGCPVDAIAEALVKAKKENDPTEKPSGYFFTYCQMLDYNTRCICRLTYLKFLGLCSNTYRLFVIKSR